MAVDAPAGAPAAGAPAAADIKAAAAATLPARAATTPAVVDAKAAAAATLPAPSSAAPPAAQHHQQPPQQLQPQMMQPQGYGGYPMQQGYGGYNPMQQQMMQQQQMQQQQQQQMMMMQNMQQMRPAAAAAGGAVIVPFANPGTVKLSGLSRDITDQLLYMLFQSAGEVKACKIIYDQMGQPTGEGMVDMADREQGRIAMESLEGREIYGSVITCEAVAVKYATNEDTTNHQCLFVGNIGNEIDDHALHEFFVGLYPSCSSARIARDTKGGDGGEARHAGYGFVTFREKSEADKAVENTGQQLGSRSLRIMHAKSQTVSAGRSNAGGATASAPPAVDTTLTEEQIAAQSEPTNTTIYVAGAPTGLTEPVVRAHFKGLLPDLEPTEVRVFPDKQYCFINYADHTICARAIHTANNTQLDGRSLRLSWGKMDSQRAVRTSAPPGVGGTAGGGGGGMGGGMHNPMMGGMMGGGPGMMGGGMGGGPPGMMGRPHPGMMGPGHMGGGPPGMMGGPMGGGGYGHHGNHPPPGHGGGYGGPMMGGGQMGGGHRYQPY